MVARERQHHHRLDARLAVDGIGVPADRVLFVDDAEPNVIGARAAGLHALLHVDVSSTRAALAGTVPALHPLPTGALA